MLFSSLTMNTQALHLDAAYSATQPFGQRLMNSMLTLATMVGASVAQLTQGTLVAHLGLQRHRVPARRCSTATRSTPRPRSSTKRLSASRPGQGIVTLRAHRPQPGRRRGRDGDARGADVVPDAGHAAIERSRHERFDLGPALLFCPADRPERYAKALERADAVILDLEDAVAPDGEGGRARRAHRVRARPRPRHRAGQPARHRRLRRRPRDAVADRLPHDHGRQGRVARSARDDRPAVRGHRAVRDGRRAWRSAERIAALDQRRRADVGRRGPRRVPRRHVEPQAERPLPRRRALRARARAARRGRARQGRDRRGAPRHRRHRSAWRSRRRMPRHPASPRPRASTRPGRRHPRRRTARRRATSRGRAACWPRPRASAACSRTRAAWSTSRCCGTRGRCCAARSSSRAQSACAASPLGATIAAVDARR